MIPVRLRLHNFMCYRGDATLDLSGIQLACLSGENGHGKSALLDALTYALWGEARARREEDLITLGMDEMEVELEFLLGSERYRVIRKRSKRGRTRQSALELQLWDGERFQAQTGTSARETQARISALLRMSYDTFINSAFLLQGRADEFARKPAGERKQILGEILGLSAYDEYEQKTRERVKQLEEETLRLNAEIMAIQQELKEKPQREAELARCEREFAQVDVKLRDAEATLQRLRDEKRELDLKARQASELELRMLSARRELQQLDSDAAAKRATIATYTTRVNDGARISDGFAQLQQMRQRNDALNELLKQSLKLTSEQSQLEHVVREQRQLLDFQLRQAEEQVGQLEAQIADADARAPELENVRQRLSALNAKEEERDQLRETRESLTTEATELRVANQQLLTHMKGLEEKIALLQSAAAACPLCGQPISADEAARLREQYTREGKQSREQYDTNVERMNQRTHQTEGIKRALTKLEQDLRAKPATQGHEARLTDLMQRAEVAQADYAQRQADVEVMRATLEQKQYAVEQQKRLEKINTRLGALGYKPDEHETIREQLAELSLFEQEHSQLQVARERLDAEREVLRHLDANSARVRQLLATDESQWLALKGELARLDDVTRSAQQQQAVVNDLQGRQAALNRQLGAARQFVEHAKQMEVTLVARQKQLKENQSERALFEELRVAFGKKGVQAMLIEAAIPEIEQEANALLNQMTDGRMQVRFETQREKVTAKQGESATIETLDIVISDDLGPRNYEMFSGGEAFRVNFAVRIALSKLLARRAGARLQTLVIDEGFGTQDAHGRERLVEAINAVRDQFECILVITHIEELKDMFPVRIDVVKTGSGSSIFVN